MKFINGSRGKESDCVATVTKGQIAFSIGAKTVAIVRPENMIDFACQILGVHPPKDLADHKLLTRYYNVITKQKEADEPLETTLALVKDHVECCACVRCVYLSSNPELFTKGR